MSNQHRYELLNEELHSFLLIEEAEPMLAEDLNMGDEAFCHLLIEDYLPNTEAEDSAI